MSRSRDKLTKDFQDKEYAHSYVNEFLNTEIATQIRVLREQRGLTQKELAEIADMKQSRISVLEDVYNDMWSISTLQRIADALDVSLKVSFETFSSRIGDMQKFSRESLKRLPRLDDLSPNFSGSEGLSNPEQRPPLQNDRREPGSADLTHTSLAGPDLLSSNQTQGPAICCCNVVVARESVSQGPDHDCAEWFRRCPIHEKDSKAYWFVDTLEEIDEIPVPLTLAGRLFRKELINRANNPDLEVAVQINHKEGTP